MKQRVLSRASAASALVALLLAALSVLLSAPPARAHAQLLETSPAADSVVASTPATVTLTFGSMVKQTYTTVVVAGSDGRSYSDGAPTVVDGQVRQQVNPLPRGRIQVTWQTVATDGAPLQGRFTFDNADTNAVAQPPSAPAAPASPSPARSEASAHAGGFADGPWWVAGALVAGTVVAGAVAFRTVGVRRSASGPRPPRGQDPPRR